MLTPHCLWQPSSQPGAGFCVFLGLLRAPQTSVCCSPTAPTYRAGAVGSPGVEQLSILYHCSLRFAGTWVRKICSGVLWAARARAAASGADDSSRGGSVTPLLVPSLPVHSPPLSVRPGEQAEHREPWGAGMQHRLLVIPPLVRSAARGFAKHSRSFCIILYGQCLSAVIIWRSFPSIFCCYTAALCASPSSPVILELLF